MIVISLTISMNDVNKNSIINGKRNDLPLIGSTPCCVISTLSNVYLQYTFEIWSIIDIFDKQKTRTLHGL